MVAGRDRGNSTVTDPDTLALAFPLDALAYPPPYTEEAFTVPETLMETFPLRSAFPVPSEKPPPYILDTCTFWMSIVTFPFAGLFFPPP